MVFKVSVEGYLDELYSVHVYEDNVGEYKFDIIAHFGQEDEEFSWEADSPVFDTLTTAVVAGFTHLVREIENYY